MSESFYQVPIDYEGLYQFSESLLEDIPKSGNARDIDSIIYPLKTILHPYSDVEQIIRKKFDQANIDMDLLSAVSVNKFILRDKALKEYTLIDVEKNGIEPIIAGNLSDLSKANLSNTFFKMGNNYYMQINVYVGYPEIQSFFFSQMKGLLVVSILSILAILSVSVFILQTILRQKKLSEIKNDFINNITHELNTPISTIAVAAKNLKHTHIKNDPEKLDALAEVIGRQNTRLQKIIASVMELSVMKNERITPRKEEVNAHQLLAEIANDFRIKYEDLDVQIVEEYEAANDNLLLDTHLFTTAVYNIMDNSIKYNIDSPKIRIRTRNDDNNFILLFEDNGIGIRKEALKYIFDKFYRVPSGNPKLSKGLGIGLFVAKKIIEAHCGEIHATSKLKKGTRFQIILGINRMLDNVEEK